MIASVGRSTACALVAAFAWAAGPAAGQTEIERGAYLAAAAGCVSCHTDFKAKGKPYAGGGPIKTPFGTFYAPNITPHPEHGIGRWSDAEFERALREGVGPDGRHYFPAFPYTSYTLMTPADAHAIKAYLFSVAPVDTPSRAHDLPFPFGWRFAQTFWKLLYFEPGPFSPRPDWDEKVNRGAYLVRAVVHCGECHTSRNALGGLKRDRWLAGAPKGAQGDAAPNITPDKQTGIGGWSDGEIADYLKIGMNPDGDFAGSTMAEVVQQSTGKLSDADRAAIVAYLRRVAPVRSEKR